MATKTSTTKNADVTLLKRAHITEKAANLGQFGTYVFDIAVGATKNEIAKAFFMTYKQKPLKVNIVNAKPKSYFRRGTLGFGKRTKKAYITIAKGATIDIV